MQIEWATAAGASGQAILRAPPFPGGEPLGRPSLRRGAAVRPRASAEILEICRAVVDARVGGSFWAQPPKQRRFGALVRFRAGLDLEKLIEACRAPGDAAILVSSPRRISGMDARGGSVRNLVGDYDAWALIASADRVFASPDDELALLAAARGRQVYDAKSGTRIETAEARIRLVRLLDSFAYADPFDGGPIDLADWIAILGRWRLEIDANRTISSVAGVRRWKSGALRRLLWSDQPIKLTSCPDMGGTPTGKAIALWPSRAPGDFLQKAADAGVEVARIEDGFIRSLGLGAHLIPPCSIVLDCAGIYYDPTRPSDLERILSETDFPPHLLERASALVCTLVQGGVTKYAAGTAASVTLPQAPRRVLVPGQVEDDQSVLLGAAGVSGNLDLLRRARLAEPDAWIAYRPHPDVSSGLRRGRIEEDEALRYADAVLTKGTISDLLDQVDAVHVLTSLAGFEALLRGCQVFTHGQPFYAGWGLTSDLGPRVMRRGRPLTLLELVAGTLILYPRYLDPLTRLPCPPEILVRRHATAPLPRPTLLNRLRRCQGKAQLLGRRLAGALW